uniref:Uncharacterized protein n=1 Tax=Hyaloperonospora arabidopsidis (strain Emoy2) TaxID=559515 RepID=M4BIJ2_HYAAE
MVFYGHGKPNMKSVSFNVAIDLKRKMSGEDNYLYTIKKDIGVGPKKRLIATELLTASITIRLDMKKRALDRRVKLTSTLMDHLASGVFVG